MSIIIKKTIVKRGIANRTRNASNNSDFTESIKIKWIEPRPCAVCKKGHKDTASPARYIDANSDTCRKCLNSRKVCYFCYIDCIRDGRPFVYEENKSQCKCSNCGVKGCIKHTTYQSRRRRLCSNCRVENIAHNKHAREELKDIYRDHPNYPLDERTSERMILVNLRPQ